MAAKAALLAMERGNIKPEQIDLIIVATITPDMPFPATACLVQQKIGAPRAAAFDMEAACSGFIYALEIGQQFIMSHTYETVLVIGAEKLSSIINWSDRNTCVLFGDGAGAAILQNRPDTHGLLTACMGADGSKADLLSLPGGGSRCPRHAAIGRRRPALPAHGRQGNLQERRQRDVHRGPGSAAPLRTRHYANQMRHPAPGQPAHHRRRRRTPRRDTRSRSSSTCTNTATPPPPPSPLPWMKR